MSERWRAGDVHGNYRDIVYDVDRGECIGAAYWPSAGTFSDPASIAEAHRRARLMAAGPVLLEALEVMIQPGPDYKSMDWPERKAATAAHIEQMRAAWEAARAAIAAFRGGE